MAIQPQTMIASAHLSLPLKLLHPVCLLNLFHVILQLKLFNLTRPLRQLQFIPWLSPTPLTVRLILTYRVNHLLSLPVMPLAVFVLKPPFLPSLLQLFYYSLFHSI